MPTRTLLFCALLGIVIIGGLVGTGLFMNRGSHLKLTGEIQKVRQTGLEPGRSVLVLDLRIKNPADYPFGIKSTDIEVEGVDGKKTVGQFIPEVDAKLLFEAYPLLGEKYNAALRVREQIPSGEQIDRMVAASFSLSEDALAARKSLTLRIVETDGAVTVLTK